MAQQTNKKHRPAEGNFPQFGLRFTSFTQKAITQLILAAEMGIMPEAWEPATIAIRLQIKGSSQERTHWLDTASAAQLIMSIVRPIGFIATKTAIELRVVDKIVASWPFDQPVPENEAWVISVAKEKGVPDSTLLVMAGKAETVEEAAPDREVKLLVEIPQDENVVQG